MIQFDCMMRSSINEPRVSVVVESHSLECALKSPVMRQFGSEVR